MQEGEDEEELEEFTAPENIYTMVTAFLFAVILSSSFLFYSVLLYSFLLYSFLFRPFQFTFTFEFHISPPPTFVFSACSRLLNSPFLTSPQLFSFLLLCIAPCSAFHSSLILSPLLTHFPPLPLPLALDLYSSSSSSVLMADYFLFSS